MMSFEFVVEGLLMPAISSFGIVGNSLSIYILRRRDLKLKPDFVTILCALATFDNLLLIATFFLFSLPTLWPQYHSHLFPYTVPYLYPTTNTFVTASCYMTAAIGVNRYLDVIGGRRRVNGMAQAVLVLLFATAINVPRWFEFETRLETVNSTVGNASSLATVMPTSLRLDDDYVTFYTLMSCSFLNVFLPIALMSLSSVLILREMLRATHTRSAVFSDEQEHCRRRRNRAITIMLIGIIVLFIVCHMGEIFISLYEMLHVVGERADFPQWTQNVVLINHLLLTLNSSLNFVIYCRDVVFRRIFVALYRAWGRKSPDVVSGVDSRVGGNNDRVVISSAAQQLRSLNCELGINLHGDPSAEVILRELDPQSMILCGLSPKNSSDRHRETSAKP